MLKEHSNSFSLFQKTVDVGVIFISWALAFTFRFYYLPHAQGGLEILFIKLAPVIAILTLYFYHQNGLYKSQRFTNKYVEIFAIFRANIQSNIVLILLLYFFADARISRIALFSYFVISSFLLTLTRILVRNYLRILRRKGKNLRSLLLVGNGPQLIQYIKTVRNFKDSGLTFAGWIDSDGLAEQNDIKPLAMTSLEAKKELSPDALVIGYPSSTSAKVEEVLKDHHNDIVPIQVVPHLSYSFIGHKVQDFEGVPILNVNQPHISGLGLFVKRSFDFLSCSIGLLIISPFLALIALGVKLSSPGPIFYGQERIGLDGKKFKMWKFRSMRMATGNEDTTTWSSKDDPRKTAFGNFIRKTSLDEFPQLWNVIVGDMSLIGPRPERPFFVDKFREEIPAYMLRHRMRAGITGWAQVNGWRGDTDLNKRIECDIYYIKNWSLLLDLKILFLTFWKGFIHKNAY
jgi:Undecaprenyl-phosphate glucose phosphotransferase